VKDQNKIRKKCELGWLLENEDHGEEGNKVELLVGQLGQKRSCACVVWGESLTS